MPEKQETTVARLESEVAELRAVLETRDEALARMKAVNDNLRASNQALREANAAGLADAGLVNASLASELDGVRAQRATDRAEIDEILATLDPILKEA